MSEPDHLFLKPQLVSQEHELLGSIFEHIKECDLRIGYRYKAKITGFIDPNLLPASVDKTLVYTGSVSLLLIAEESAHPCHESRPHTSKNVLSVFDLPDDYSERKQELFDQLGLRYQYLSQENKLPRIDCSVEKAIQQQHPCVGLTEQDSEAFCYDLLSRICLASSLIFLSEMAADEVFFPHFSTDAIEQKHANFLKKTSFDGIAVTLPPYSRPLAAFEVDGTIHDRLDKKEKDKNKNEICHRANFPLFRIDARRGLDVLNRSEGMLAGVLHRALQALSSRLDSTNTWEKYIQHEIQKMGDQWRKDDLMRLVQKTMDDVHSLKAEIRRLREPDPIVQMQEDEWQEQYEAEEEYKEKIEAESRLRKMENIQEEIFFDPYGRPPSPFLIYSDQTETQVRDHGVEIGPKFKLRTRYKGIGFKEEQRLEPIYLPLRFGMPYEFREAVEDATGEGINEFLVSSFSKVFSDYFEKNRAKIEKSVREKIRRLRNVH